MPLISVVTVCFQAADYIAGCIDSVLSQDFEDFEYVILDGGSTDGTAYIIAGYADRLAYWHTRKDRGVADAFSQGVQASSGDWILFLNSDDFLANKGVLSQMARHLRSAGDVDVIFGQVQRVAREKDLRTIGSPFGGEYSWREFVLRDTIPHPAAFTRRCYFDRVGLFSVEYRIAMDYEHYLRAGPGLAARFVPLLVSNMRDGGISRQDFSAVLYEWERSHLEAGHLPVWRVKVLKWWLQVRHMFGTVSQSAKKLVWRRNSHDRC